MRKYAAIVIDEDRNSRNELTANAFMGMAHILKSSEPPTTDRIRLDNSLKSLGDAVDTPDVAAAPLGTDDEAAGHPPTRQQLRMEDRERALPNKLTASNGPVIFFTGIVAAIAADIAIAAVLF